MPKHDLKCIEDPDRPNDYLMIHVKHYDPKKHKLFNDIALKSSISDIRQELSDILNVPSRSKFDFSNMTRAERLTFARDNGINVSDIKSKTELLRRLEERKELNNLGSNQ